MEVLKTTSPTISLRAPKDRPSKKVPSASARTALVIRHPPRFGPVQTPNVLLPRYASPALLQHVREMAYCGSWRRSHRRQWSTAPPDPPPRYRRVRRERAVHRATETPEPGRTSKAQPHAPPGARLSRRDPAPREARFPSPPRR